MKKLTAKLVLSFGIATSMLIGVGAISSGAQAQSFSCALAVAPSEFAICNNETLLVKDEKLAQLFSAVVEKADRKNAATRLSAEQSLWLKQRDECKIDFKCLEKHYDDRIERLSDK